MEYPNLPPICQNHIIISGFVVFNMWLVGAESMPKRMAWRSKRGGQRRLHYGFGNKLINKKLWTCSLGFDLEAAKISP